MAKYGSRQNSLFFGEDCHFLGASSLYWRQGFISSVRSSNSHPDLLLTHHHPLFQITRVLNTGLSLSEPLQLYHKQSLDSSAGYVYPLRKQQDIMQYHAIPCNTM